MCAQLLELFKSSVFDQQFACPCHCYSCFASLTNFLDLNLKCTRSINYVLNIILFAKMFAISTLRPDGARCVSSGRWCLATTCQCNSFSFVIECQITTMCILHSNHQRRLECRNTFRAAHEQKCRLVAPHATVCTVHPFHYMRTDFHDSPDARPDVSKSTGIRCHDFQT